MLSSVNKNIIQHFNPVEILGTTQKVQHALTPHQLTASRECLLRSLKSNIDAAIKAKNVSIASGQFANLKTILGPLDTLIRVSEDHDTEAQLSFDLIKAQAIGTVWDAIRAELENCEKLFRNIQNLKKYREFIIADKELDATQKQVTLKNYQRLLDSHQDVAVKLITRGEGFGCYQKWCWDNQKALIHIALHVTTKKDEICFDAGVKNKIKKLIHANIIKSLENNCWEKIYNTADNITHRISEQLLPYLNRILNTFDNVLTNSTNMEELYNNFDTQGKKFLLAAHDVIQKRKVLLNKSEDANKKFAVYVRDWFETFKHEIFSKQKIADINALVENIIAHKSLEPWQLTSEEVHDIRLRIIKIPFYDIACAYLAELEKRYPDPGIIRVINHTAAVSLHQTGLTSQNDLTAVIKNPLEWHALKNCLELFYARSDLQVTLKIYLNKYICGKLQAKSNSADEIEIRRYIEYLLSCLNMAKKQQVDINNIFSLSANIGLNYILNTTKSSTNEMQEFVQGLQSIFRELKDGLILFLRPLAGDLISLSDAVDAKAKNLIPISSGESFQLYWKNYNKFLYAPKTISPEVKFSYLFEACLYLVQASINGDKQARGRLFVPAQNTMSYEFIKQVNDEFKARLLKISKDSDDYIQAQWHLFRYYYLRRENVFYSHYSERLEDIITGLTHLLNVPEQEYIDLKVEHHLSAYRENRIAWYILVNELLGSPLFFVNADKEKYSPFPLLTLNEFNSLLGNSIADIPEKKSILNTLADLCSKYRKNFKRMIVEMDFSDRYTININADIFKKCATNYISFIDYHTKQEVARLEKNNQSVTFRSFGADFGLVINGCNDIETFILECQGSTIHLAADFNHTNFNFQGNVETLLFTGNIRTSRLNWEMPGYVILDEETIITSQNAGFKCRDIEVHGEIYSKSVSHFEITNTMRVGGAKSEYTKNNTSGKVTSSGPITINAGMITDINGSIVSGAHLVLKTDKSLPLRENSVLQSADLTLVAPEVISTGARVNVSNQANLVIANDIIIREKSNWKIKTLTLKSKRLKNFSHLLNFTRADLTVIEVINYRGGVIKAIELLRLRGDILRNAGEINFGKQLDAGLDKYVLHGFVDANDIRTFTSISNRPAFIGKNANIITGVYVNLVGKLATSALSITSVVDITLAGLTMSTNRIKSRIFALDLGVDIPNIQEIASDILQFVDNVADGKFSQALEMLCTSGAVFKGSQFVSWIFKTFIPQLGAPIDLVWTIFTIMMRTPAFLNQLYTLATQNKSDFRYMQLYSLINTTNSLATQGVFLEGRLIGLSHGIPAFEIASAPPAATLLLDIVALVSPYSSSTALFKVGGGLQISPSISDRSLISINQFNAKLGFNVSESFYFSQQDNTLTVANNYSQVGQRSIDTGTVLASTVSTNINDDTRSGTTLANTVFRNSDDYHEEKGSSTQALTYILNTRTASLEGKNESERVLLHASEALNSSGIFVADSLSAESDTTNFSGDTRATTFSSHSTGNTQLHGHLQTSHATIISNANANTDAKIDLERDATSDDSNRPSLHIAGRNVNSTSTVEGKDGDVIIDAHEKASLAGEVVSTGLSVRAGESIKNKAHIKIQQADFEAKDEIDNEGKSEFQAEGKDHFLRFSADKVNMAAENEVKGEGLLSVHAQTGSINGNVDVSNFELALAHVPDIEDLLQKKGRYANVHFSKGVSVKSSDQLTLGRKMDVDYSISLTVTSLEVAADIHSTHNILFSTTDGNIHIGQHTLAADQYLELDSHGNFVGDKSTLMGYEVAINALQKVVNNGGVWGAENYFSIVAGGDVEINCLSTDVQGKYDTMKAYQPGYLIGGVGAEHDGVGLFVQTDGKFILLGSSVESQGSNEIHAKKGIDLEALYHKYISYYRNYHNWTGRKSVTTDYSFQLQPAVIYSKNGSNSLFASDGSIYSVSAEFYAGKENNLTAKHDVKLLGYILEEREVKERRNLCLHDLKTDERNQVAVPTEVVTVANTNIRAEDGSIVQTNAEIHSGGKVTETAAGNILIEAPVLKSRLTIESSGVTISTPVLNLASQPLAQDFQGITQARGIAPIAAAISNSVIDSLNFANTFLSGIRNGSLQKGFLQATNLASVEVGYTHTATSMENETVAPNAGIESNDIELDAGGSVDVGATLAAEDEIDITSTNASIHGQETHSSFDQLSESVSVGESAYADPTVSASISGASGHGTEQENTHVLASRVNITTTNKTEIEDADIDAKNIKVKAHELHMESKTGESSSQQWSVGGSTSGQVSASVDETHSRTIHEVTAMHATENLDVEAVDTTITGAKIISDGTGTFKTNTLTTHTVREEKEEKGFGFSGPCGNSSTTQANGESTPCDDSTAIPTATVNLANRDDNGKQEATLYFAGGGHVSINSMTPGSDPLNQNNADGHEMRKGTDFDITIKIPISGPNLKDIKDNYDGARNELFPDKSSPEEKFERPELPPLSDEKPTFDEPRPPYDDAPASEAEQADVSKIFGAHLDEDLNDDFQQTSGQLSAETAAKSNIRSSDKREAKASADDDVADSTSSINTAWVNSKTTRYAQLVFQSPGFSSDAAPDQNLANASSTDAEEEKIFPAESSESSSLNIAIPDPRASSSSFFGRYYRPSMPTAPTTDYATASVGVFEDEKETSYGSASDYVNNPQSVDLETRHSGFQSGTSEYLDQVQLMQNQDAATPMTFEKKTAGEKLKDVSDATFNMNNVDSFNNAVAASRDGVVHAISNPRETIENAVITNWDILNGVSEIATGVTTQGAHDRNVARGKAYHEEAEEFKYGTAADRVGIVTGVVSSIILTEAVAVPITMGAVKVARAGWDALSTSSKTIPRESVGKMPESIPDNSPEKMRTPSLPDESGEEIDPYTVETTLPESDGASVPTSKFEREQAPARSTSQRWDESSLSSEEISDSTIPINDRYYPSKPGAPAVGKTDAFQSQLLNQHGLFREGIEYSEPLKKVAGSDALFHHADEAGSNSYVTHRQYEETIAGKRSGSGKGGSGPGNVSHERGFSESSGSGSSHGANHAADRTSTNIEVPDIFKKVKLPYGVGDFPFKPPKKWRPHMDLVRGDKDGFMDAEDNQWIKGRAKGYKDRSNMHNQDKFEWDVQIHPKNYAKYKHLLKGKKHLNVSSDGIITHGKNPDVTPSGRRK